MLLEPPIPSAQQVTLAGMGVMGLASGGGEGIVVEGVEAAVLLWLLHKPQRATAAFISSSNRI